MSNNLKTSQHIDSSTADDHQILAITSAHIHACGMGYLSEGNRPDNTVRIEIMGTPSVGTVTRFIMFFYPVCDDRLINPFFDTNRTQLTITQTLAALPGWIAALTAIPKNESSLVSYSATQDRYEFECLRILTQK